MAIINDVELKKDYVESLAKYLSVDVKEVEDVTIDDDLEALLDKMYEANSEFILNISPLIKRRIKKNGK